jgi:hypothetical protein
MHSFYRRSVKGRLQTGEFMMNALWDFEELVWSWHSCPLCRQHIKSSGQECPLTFLGPWGLKTHFSRTQICLEGGCYGKQFIVSRCKTVVNPRDDPGSKEVRN